MFINFREGNKGREVEREREREKHQLGVPLMPYLGIEPAT